MSKAGDLSGDIEFLFEMGNIRRIDRFWKRFNMDNTANLAEHKFRMFWIAMVIAAHESGVDTGKIAKMVLVHDITESRTGDVDYISRQYVERKEDKAIKDMLSGTKLNVEFSDLWAEYQAKKTKEAQIVKDADNLDVDFELREQEAKGNKLPKLWSKHRKEQVRKKLYTIAAKKIFDKLETSDPNDWHMNAPNRANTGDWLDAKTT